MEDTVGHCCLHAQKPPVDSAVLGPAALQNLLTSRIWGALPPTCFSVLPSVLSFPLL